MLPADSFDRPATAGPPDVPDEDLERRRVAQAQAGDPHVWELWFDEYYSRLYRYAYFRLRRASDAEDLVAQVFLEAVRGIGKYRYLGRPILAWFYGIAHNLIADRLKKEAARAPGEGRPVVAASLEDGLVENIDLLLALDDLTDEQREVVILRFLVGLSAKEVASLLGKTEPAVFSLQARALVALRGRLGEGGRL